jgi:stage II sporulation SpoAA-like protein
MHRFIDETQWPIVVVHWHGALAQEDLSVFLTRMDAWLAQGERFGLLIDSRAAEGMSPEQRVQVIDHMKQRAALTSRFLVQAIVLDSLLHRTLFYGINLLFPNPFPSKVFASPETARTWLGLTLSVLAREN